MVFAYVSTLPIIRERRRKINRYGQVLVFLRLARLNPQRNQLVMMDKNSERGSEMRGKELKTAAGRNL